VSKLYTDADSSRQSAISEEKGESHLTRQKATEMWRSSEKDCTRNK